MHVQRDLVISVTNVQLKDMWNINLQPIQQPSCWHSCILVSWCMPSEHSWEKIAGGVILQICSFDYPVFLPRCRICNDAGGVANVAGVVDSVDARDTLTSSFASPRQALGRFSLILLCWLLYTHFYYKHSTTKNKRKLIRFACLWRREKIGIFLACQSGTEMWIGKRICQCVGVGTNSLAFVFMTLIILACSQSCLFTTVHQLGLVELRNKSSHANGWNIILCYMK